MKDKLIEDPKIQKLITLLSTIGENGIEPGEVNAALAHLGELPPFLRALLVTDGTVTMALEAYFSEKIKIRTLRQGKIRVPISIPSLALSKNDECFFREIELYGEVSGRCYGHASSILNKKAIDADLFDELVDENVGIGVILRNVTRGSFREVLNIERGNVMVDSDLIRSYRVSINALPAILITEEFSLSVFS